jgi:putative sigma-54 modulation protein
MQIIIKGKQMEVTPQLRQHIERKVQRLSRLVDTEARIEITVAEEQTRSARDRYSVQMMLTGPQPVRSEVSALNAKMALDLVLDKVETQLERKKDRHTSAVRKRIPAVKVLSLSRSGAIAPIDGEEEGEDGTQDQQYDESAGKGTASAIAKNHNEEIWSRVLEIRRVPGKPMDDQEVIAQMETLGLSFLPFYNEATNSVNVMYRLSRGGYGLLVPELD